MNKELPEQLLNHSALANKAEGILPSSLTWLNRNIQIFKILTFSISNQIRMNEATGDALLVITESGTLF